MTEPAGRRPGPGPQPGAPSPGIKTVCYAENHCALRWPLLAAGLAAPVIVVANAVAGIVLGSAWFLAVLVAAVAVAATAGSGGGAPPSPQPQPAQRAASDRPRLKLRPQAGKCEAPGLKVNSYMQCSLTASSD